MEHVEERTDQEMDYKRAQEIYLRIQKKEPKAQADDLKTLRADVPRTYPEEPFFNTDEAPGRRSLDQLLRTLIKHSSSTGYTQGMNNIAAVLIFHSDEVFAFDLMIKLLNDYHLKEVTMNSLYGLHMNCDVLSALVKVELPRLGEHFKKTGVSPFQFSHNWIFTLFSQNIPLGQI